MEMTRDRAWLIISSIAAIILAFMQFCGNKKVNPDIYPKDTIVVEKLIIDRDTIILEKNVSKPVYVEKYLTDTLIIVDNHTDTLKIPGSQIPQLFPSLISGSFQEDHFKLITRDTSGRLTNQIHIYDWIKNFEYRFDGYSGKVITIPRKGSDLSEDFGNGGLSGEDIAKLQRGIQSNIYLLYGTRKNFMFRADASWNYKKFGLYLYGQLNTAMPNAEAGGGLKYRLK
jgi:hypothetical protein